MFNLDVHGEPAVAVLDEDTVDEGPPAEVIEIGPVAQYIVRDSAGALRASFHDTVPEYASERASRFLRHVGRRDWQKFEVRGGIETLLATVAGMDW